MSQREREAGAARLLASWIAAFPWRRFLLGVGDAPQEESVLAEILERSIIDVLLDVAHDAGEHLILLAFRVPRRSSRRVFFVEAGRGWRAAFPQRCMRASSVAAAALRELGPGRTRRVTVGAPRWSPRNFERFVEVRGTSATLRARHRARFQALLPPRCRKLRHDAPPWIAESSGFRVAQRLRVEPPWREKGAPHDERASSAGRRTFDVESPVEHAYASVPRSSSTSLSRCSARRRRVPFAERCMRGTMVEHA